MIFGLEEFQKASLYVRNFIVVAAIDHGMSTLMDSLLAQSGMILAKTTCSRDSRQNNLLLSARPYGKLYYESFCDPEKEKRLRSQVFCFVFCWTHAKGTGILGMLPRDIMKHIALMMLSLGYGEIMGNPRAIILNMLAFDRLAEVIVFVHLSKVLFDAWFVLTTKA